MDGDHSIHEPPWHYRFKSKKFLSLHLKTADHVLIAAFKLLHFISIYSIISVITTHTQREGNCRCGWLTVWTTPNYSQYDKRIHSSSSTQDSGLYTNTRNTGGYTTTRGLWVVNTVRPRVEMCHIHKQKYFSSLLQNVVFSCKLRPLFQYVSPLLIFCFKNDPI